jgi:multiple sugar transport system permease protein
MKGGFAVDVKYNARKPLKLHAWWVPLAFLLPHLIVFCCFNIFPILTGVYASFTKWTLGRAPEWVGLANYKALFVNTDSMYYWQLRWGMCNTIKFVILCVPFRILVPLTLALLLSTQCRGHKLLQVFYYLPSLLSLSVVMVSWSYMFDSSSGIINNLLGLGKLKWTTTSPYDWIAIIFITVWWGCGSNLIIYQSALAGVSTEIQEAASVDGASAFQKFIHITIPSIKFPLQYTLITSVIAEFGIWGQPDMFNNGGATIEVVNGFHRQSNKMIMQYITESGFGSSGVNASVASAMALILGVIIFSVSLIQFRAMRRNNE